MTETKPTKSLKAQNVPWLVALVVFDILVLLLFLFPEVVGAASLERVTALRALLTAVLPVAVLILAGLLDSELKAKLIYWRLSDVLPGHRAFTKHGPSDSRIDIAALEEHVGELPTAPREQNSFWYRLYTAVRDDTAVAEAHKAYLLFRDMAAISLPLIVAIPIGLLVNGSSLAAASMAGAFFSVQYILTAIASRNSGVRLVTSVLAIHSAKRVELQ